ncbi:hypothetical protein Droror1_Dr00013562 [Drosera rotundifolia]
MYLSLLLLMFHRLMTANAWLMKPFISLAEEINFRGSFYVTKFAIPHLKRSCGKIIVVASLTRYNPHPRTSLYNATKAAMVNFFEKLRVELGSKIKIVIAAPFYTESETTEGKSLVRKDEMKYNLQLKNYIKDVFNSRI